MVFFLSACFLIRPSLATCKKVRSSRQSEAALWPEACAAKPVARARTACGPAGGHEILLHIYGLGGQSTNPRWIHSGTTLSASRLQLQTYRMHPKSTTKTQGMRVMAICRALAKAAHRRLPSDG